MICRTSLFLALLTGSACWADVSLEVRAGGHDRVNCPVTCRIPESLADEKQFTLIRDEDGREIPVQTIGPRQQRRLIFMVEKPLKADTRRRYTLSAGRSGRRKPAVTCREVDGTLKLAVDGATVLHFNVDTVEPPPGIDDVYRRSGYIHPVFTPQGAVVTGDFEKDHPHQHGVFFAWVNATYEGQGVDFWNQAKGSGGIECKSVQNRRAGGAVFAQFAAKLSHFALRDGKKLPVLDEVFQVRVYNSSKPFLVEITSRQSPVQGPLVLGEHRYGGFALRGPSAWLTTETSPAAVGPGDDPIAAGDFLTSSARTRADGNHTRARWVEMHGPVGSDHAGIIALSAPGNFRAPQTVRLHPNKPYFCFAPMVLGSFTIRSGETYTSRYRLVIHDGGPDAKLAERTWQDLAHPARVVVVDKTAGDS